MSRNDEGLPGENEEGKRTAERVNQFLLGRDFNERIKGITEQNTLERSKANVDPSVGARRRLSRSRSIEFVDGVFLPGLSAIAFGSFAAMVGPAIDLIYFQGEGIARMPFNSGLIGCAIAVGLPVTVGVFFGARALTRAMRG